MRCGSMHWPSNRLACFSPHHQITRWKHGHPPNLFRTNVQENSKHAEPVNLKYSCRFNSGARLTFTDMYFAALTVNITTFIFVFPTTGWVVVWHVEVNSFWKCKYSSWAFMLSCQTSSQQWQTDLRAGGGLGVAPLPDCRIWLIISEWWSCHHNRSVSSLHTATAMRRNARSGAQTDPPPSLSLSLCLSLL